MQNYRNETLLTTSEAAEVLRLQKNTLEVWRCTGKGPRFTRFGRAIRYRQVDLDKFIQDNLHCNTSDDHGPKICAMV